MSYGTQSFLMNVRLPVDVFFPHSIMPFFCARIDDILPCMHSGPNSRRHQQFSSWLPQVSQMFRIYLCRKCGISAVVNTPEISLTMNLDTAKALASCLSFYMTTPSSYFFTAPKEKVP